MARFLGTNSPNTMAAPVARTNAITNDTAGRTSRR